MDSILESDKLQGEKVKINGDMKCQKTEPNILSL